MNKLLESKLNASATMEETELWETDALECTVTVIHNAIVESVRIEHVLIQKIKISSAVMTRRPNVVSARI